MLLYPIVVMLTQILLLRSKYVFNKSVQMKRKSISGSSLAQQTWSQKCWVCSLLVGHSMAGLLWFFTGLDFCFGGDGKIALGNPMLFRASKVPSGSIIVLMA